MLDGRNDPVKRTAAESTDVEEEASLMAAADEDKDDEKDAADEDWHSITEPAQPLTNDRYISEQTDSQGLSDSVTVNVNANQNF